ncbi:MAG: POTRA domain-containing protein, partial [Myxococcota bacterium]|nr:POTRA domain-containing protein [Myxococcota bacterium]
MLGLWLLCQTIDAKPAEYEIPTIAEGLVERLEFVGFENIDEAALRYAVRIQAGSTLDPNQVRSAIRALYATGYIDDIQVEMLENRTLRFYIKEKPAIYAWKIEGNSEFEADVLNELVEDENLRVVNQAQIQKIVQAMREKYLEKGFYLVEIKPRFVPVSSDQVELIFDIDEKRKVSIQRISFSGNENVPSSKIRQYLQTREAGPLPWLTGSGNFNEALLENDLQIIRSVFMEEGFAEVKVGQPHTFLSMDKRFIYINIDIEEGLQYKLGSIDVSGDLVPEEGLTQSAIAELLNGATAKQISDRWRRYQKDGDGWEKKSEILSFQARRPPLKKGDVFKLSSLQMVMKEIADFYGDQGYAFANVVPITKPNKETGEMNITFDIQKGKKVRINRIDIIGNDPTLDMVVRREIPINEGDLYSGSGIQDARMRLMRLGFFEDVNITTPRSANPDELDLKVDVIEQPTGSFSVGAGFSNLENFMFNANISKNNFLGRGYTMSVAANVSSVRQQGNLQIYDPYFLDSRWTLRVHGYSI